MTWCVGADCERIDTPANTDFVNAAANLNMVMEMGGGEFDRRNMRIFSGEREFCTIRLLGGQDCCTDSGVFIEAGLLGCQAHEIELAEARAAGVNRARALLEKKGYELKGLAPSASAAQTLAAEANRETETLQRFLLRNAGVAEGRLTKKGARAMREAFKNTVLVVDEGSLASTVQARNLLRIAREIRLPKVILVGDGKQLDAVDAGKPFVQLQNAGMKTATMDRIMRQKDEVLREAFEASLRGDIKKAFEKLGSNIEEVKPDNLAGAAAARWLKLSPEERERAGLMAPSHKLRVAINDIVRQRLIRDERVKGKAIETERLASKGYTNAQKALAGNYAAGDVVGFHRQYKRLGIDKGDELRVLRVDQEAGAVSLKGRDGTAVEWIPRRVAARTGGVEVYRSENIELRQGDRIRWTRNDLSLGLVNSQTADVTKVEKDAVTFRLEDGGTLELQHGDSQLRHIDRAWASTVHAFQGRTVDTVIAAMEAEHPHLTTHKTMYKFDQFRLPCAVQRSDTLT